MVAMLAVLGPLLEFSSDLGDVVHLAPVFVLLVRVGYIIVLVDC
jgi:hypothetical protein